MKNKDSLKIISVFSLLGCLSGVTSSYIVNHPMLNYPEILIMSIKLLLPGLLFGFSIALGFIIISFYPFGSLSFNKKLSTFIILSTFAYLISAIFSLYSFFPSILLNMELIFLSISIIIGGPLISIALRMILGKFNSYQTYIIVLLIVGSSIVSYIFSDPQQLSPHLIFIFWQTYVGIMIGILVNLEYKKIKTASN